MIKFQKSGMSDKIESFDFFDMRVFTIDLHLIDWNSFVGFSI